MSNYNLEVLLEKSEKVSLGIRSRQSGITLKEYFLNQKLRVRNIMKAQKAKLNEALKVASGMSNSGKHGKINARVRITNKSGKYEVRLISSEGMSAERVFGNMRKTTSEIYAVIKYRCNMIEKLCNEGIKKASTIIKGKTDAKTVSDAKAIKVDVKEYNILLNSSLSEMREVFKAYHAALR